MVAWQWCPPRNVTVLQRRYRRVPRTCSTSTARTPGVRWLLLRKTCATSLRSASLAVRHVGRGRGLSPGQASRRNTREINETLFSLRQTSSRSSRPVMKASSLSRVQISTTGSRRRSWRRREVGKRERVVELYSSNLPTTEYRHCSWRLGTMTDRFSCAFQHAVRMSIQYTCSTTLNVQCIERTHMYSYAVKSLH